MNSTELVLLTDRLSDDLTAGADSLAGFLESARAVDDDREVLAVAAALIRLRNIVDHALVRVAATVVRTELPARKHVRSVANVLKELGMAPAAAHRLARLAGALRETPEVSRGMRDGTVAAEFGDAVVRGLDFVQRRVTLTAETRKRLTASLMVKSTPKTVEEKARAWALALAPPETAPETVPVAERIDLNEMTLTQTDDGRVGITVDLDVVSGEELNAALDPLCRPVPEPDGSADRRPAARRRADALGQIVRTYLSGSSRPESGGVLPHVTLVAPATAVPAPSAPGSTIPGSTGKDSSAAPSGAQPVPALGFCGPVSRHTAELVMCESSVTVALVDGHGVPLSVGREKRLLPPAIRKALVVRDGGCAFPGCGAPTSWCDAHHVEHWEHGGETSVGNGVLLCRRHHTLIHHSAWEVFIGHDGHPWFLAPVDSENPSGASGRERPAPDRVPLRSHGRRTLTSLPSAA